MVMIDGLHNRADNLISTTVKNAERLQCVCQNPLSFMLMPAIKIAMIRYKNKLDAVKQLKMALNHHYAICFHQRITW